MNLKRGLIIKKEWLDKIFYEGKIWEMRTTKTKITGKIGLIESGSVLIMGEAELIGCSRDKIEKDKDFIKYHGIEDLDLLDTWGYAWYLDRVKRYETPIPYKHPKGAVIWVKL